MYRFQLYERGINTCPSRYNLEFQLQLLQIPNDKMFLYFNGQHLTQVQPISPELLQQLPNCSLHLPLWPLPLLNSPHLNKNMLIIYISMCVIYIYDQILPFFTILYEIPISFRVSLNSQHSLFNLTLSGSWNFSSSLATFPPHSLGSNHMEVSDILCPLLLDSP